MKSWLDFFELAKEKPYWNNMVNFWNEEYKNKTIYPTRENIFNSFKLVPLDKLKIVIIGQDPYHEPNQAMGLAFSVPSTSILPPSLKNIYKELQLEYGLDNGNNGDLTYLSNQGVFLINTILTVEEHKALSHNIKEYNLFFKDFLKYLDDVDAPIVFMLWGGHAKKYKKFITNKNRLILEANHPSPLSANRGGWFGCNHFKISNEYLIKNNLKSIDWIRK